MKPWKNNQPHRSILVVPANNTNMAKKAAIADVDVINLDLEDAVDLSDKVSARANLLEILDTLDFKDKKVVVRINGLDTPYGESDLSAIKDHPRVSAISIPKVETEEQLKKAHEIAPTKALWAAFEDPKGIFNIRDILKSSAELGVEALVFGNNDFAKAAGLTTDNPMLHPRGEVTMAARAHGLMVFDGPSTNLYQKSLADGDNIKAHANRARELGFDGLIAIHPSQISIINKVFSPTALEMANAQKIITHTENISKGVVAVDGQMVEDLHKRRALEVIAMGKAIKAKGSPESAR